MPLTLTLDRHGEQLVAAHLRTGRYHSPEEEATPATEALLERLRAGEPGVVPAHWPTEVMNGLVMALRRGRIDLERVARFARDLAALPIRIEPPHGPAVWDAVIRVATKHQLTVYDAAYLELAERTRLPLATLDG